MCASTPWAQGASGRPSQSFDADTVRAAITEIATIIGREYMDAAVGDRVAESLRRRLNARAYAKVTTPEELASLVTRDLLLESQDKHLSVAVVRESPSASRVARVVET